MLGIGLPELLFVLVLLVVAFRPEQLAELARSGGHLAGRLWRMGQQLRDEVEREWKEEPPAS
jgi:Sec-independent protein translocase protein TatA